jgi:addiction module RelE/StbE family toxin
MRLRWTERALADLKRIRSHIEGDDPAAAQRMVQRLVEASWRLSDFPRMGRPGKIVGARELVVPRTPYYLAYRMLEGEVEILRAMRGAQDLADV